MTESDPIARSVSGLAKNVARDQRPQDSLSELLFCVPVAVTNPCGCRIVGTGTGTDPLRIFWCEHHAVINDIREAAPLARDARAVHDAAKAREPMAEADLLTALIIEVKDAMSSLCGPVGSRSCGWAEIIRHPPRSGLGLAIDADGYFHTIRADGYDGDRELVHLEQTSAVDAVAVFGLHNILDALADALDAAMGQRKAAEKIEKRIAIVQAVTLLLRGGKELGR